MKVLLLVVACVACGALAGMVIRGAALADAPAGRDEQLARGARAVQAASSVLVAVRWHAEGVTISRAQCETAGAGGQWRCMVRFRDRDGNDLSGEGDPAVTVRFRGPARTASLTSCLLSDPQMGRGVDCTARARAALKAGR